MMQFLPFFRMGQNLAALGGIVPTSYANTGGTGDRTAVITVTQTTNSSGSATGSPLTEYQASAQLSLINGLNVDNESYMEMADVTGKFIRFDFGTGKVIQEAKWYQSGTQSHGTWKWQGSNDGSAWTDIGGSFTLGGATTQTQTSLSGNNSFFRYYRLLGVSGNASDSPWIKELEFKISA